jgi:rubrerythrin
MTADQPPRRCPKCGSPAKAFPEDFPASDTRWWPFRKMSGGPERSRPVLVCPVCGHNEDLRRAK